MFQWLFTDEAGATMVEYGILVALIAVLSILVIKSIGSKVSNAFSSIDANL
jgi:Flp pilus assembly pilin Flp